jgi:hypothetical protein
MDHDFIWEHAPGEWTTIEYVNGELAPHHYFPEIAKKSTKMHESILKKIKAGNVTAAEFDEFINESLSVINRVRERTRIDPTASHIDKTGRQPLDPEPEVPTPKRRPSNRSKSNGRGRQARRRSARTERQKVTEQVVEQVGKYDEAVQFVNDNIDKSIEECDLSNVNDKKSLHDLLTRMLSDNSWCGNSINVDWVYDIRGLIKA